MINKMSLVNRIIKYFIHRPHLWVNGGEIEALALKAGFKASNASRRLRELANDGTLERKIEGGSVWYKYRDKNDYSRVWPENFL